MADRDPQDGDENYVWVEYPDGTRTRFRRRSIAAAFATESSVEQWDEHIRGYSEKPWSLDRIIDLLWRHSRRSRPAILREVHWEFEHAMENDRMPGRVNPWELLTLAYWHEVLRPLLESPAIDRHALREELEFLHVGLTYTGPQADYVKSQIRDFARECIDDTEWLQRISDVYPEVYAVLQE